MIIYYNAKKGKRKIFHESSKPTPTKKNQIFYFIIFTFVNESIPFKASNVNYFDLKKRKHRKCHWFCTCGFLKSPNMIRILMGILFSQKQSASYLFVWRMTLISIPTSSEYSIAWVSARIPVLWKQLAAALGRDQR